MKIKKIYVYPIKSLRGIELPSAALTTNGFPYDRRFMLLRDYHDDTSKSSSGTRYENMSIGKVSEMCLFKTSMTVPNEDNPHGELEITYTNPDDQSTTTQKIPLEPDTASLEDIDISMHRSDTTGYKMPNDVCDWFSACFGYDVILVYIGRHRRNVLGNLAPNAATRNLQRRKEHEGTQDGAKSSGSWLSSLVNNMPGLPTVFSSGAAPAEDTYDYQIGFADICPYLIVSQTSLENVSERLPEGIDMDITKFRPNIILEGAPEAFEEDFWGEICISGSSPPAEANGQNGDAEDGDHSVTLVLTANCLRCVSITVDYDTGEYSAAPAGQVYKKLQTDRRIDTGHKYSPAFGRYGFLTSQSVEMGKNGFVVSVGDEVEVSKRNEQRTVFKYPGIGQTPKTDLYPVEA